MKSGKKRMTSFAALAKGYNLRTSARFRWSVYAVLTIGLFFILVGTVLPMRYNLAVGQVSQALIRAPIDAVDTHATAVARLAAAALVPPQYNINPATEQQALGALDRLFNAVNSVRANRGLTPTERLTELRAIAPKRLSNAVLNTLLTQKASQLVVVDSAVVRIVQQLLQADFSTSDMRHASLIVDQQLVTLPADAPTRLIIGQIVLSVLQPNLVYNAVLTQGARSAAQRSVPDVWINRGDVIVRRGQLITPTIMSQLQDLKLLKTEPDYGIYAGYFFFVAILVLATAAFIQLRRARVARDNVYLILYAMIILSLAVGIRLTQAAVQVGLPSDVSYAIPVAMASMMITMFFGTSLAMLSSVLLALLTCAAFGFEFQHFFTPLLSALGATMAMTRVQHRSVFMRAGFLAAGLNVCGVTIMHFLLTSTTAGLHQLGYDEVYAVMGGLLSAVLTIGLMPFLETAFGVTTHMGLLELANPNHPLLRRLLLEAPGTYHHSLIVGNLAESAAETVGADPLLCRVGAYYHDVGKMKRPQFFVENQVAGENPHDKVAPNLSYLIVTSHVSDGLQMLEEYKLPEPIRDICAEHHGTTVLWYFYNKAVEEDKHSTPDMDQYRYPGPRPQSKEAAIVMMCDAVEASVRSIGKPTPQRIEAMIRKIIKERLQDGQLDQCDITLRDLDRMVAAFMRTLQGIYHERIEYPESAKALEARAR